MSSESAKKTWEAVNNVETVDSVDAIFKYDTAAQKKMMAGQPWKKDPQYFKHCKISALALLKMTMHARSGGKKEVMGVMTGKLGGKNGDVMVVMDAFALPVEGTETRVNAGDEANEYMINYVESLKKVGKQENLIGWYHSHPGYGCWLSGIDVSTQLLQQMYQDPFLAVVIDPNRTVSTGKVEIGAFRTYPKDYKPEENSDGWSQSVPTDKIKDFGVHNKSYYPLDISYFKSSLDERVLKVLWNEYWVSILASSTLITNHSYMTNQIKDLVKKLKSAEHALLSGTDTYQRRYTPLMRREKNNVDELEKPMKDCETLADEARRDLIAQNVQTDMFNLTGNLFDTLKLTDNLTKLDLTSLIGKE